MRREEYKVRKGRRAISDPTRSRQARLRAKGRRQRRAMAVR